MEKTYKYTIDGGSFTKEQREFYEKNGYIVFRKLISDEAIDECIKRFIEICNEENPSCTVVQNLYLVKENAKGEHSVNKVQDILFDEIIYKNITTNKNLVKYVQNITGPDVTAIHAMLINKPPNSSPEYSAHPTHQDLHYFPFRPANSIVAAWIAMENSTVRNGSLYLIPGSHKLPLLPHRFPPNTENKMYQEVSEYNDIPKLHMEMEKGDTVFFHPLMLHGSGPNLTKGFRKAFTVHFTNSNMEFIEVKGTSQDFLGSEVVKFDKNKIKFIDFWRSSRRQVTGKPGKFLNITSSM